jgi:carnitine 3-dehydrogenase / betainyl-CoA thioesterase
MKDVKTAAIVGTGVIGAGWATRFLAHGLDVVAWDPAPEAEAKLRAAVDSAWPAVGKLGLYPGADRARLSFAASLEGLCAQADFVQENAPEREELKQDLLAKIDATSKPEAIIASSTSGFLPSSLQSRCRRNPERVLVGHPFNPVYLLPLVEIVGGEKTAPEASDRAARFYEAMGMHALKVRKEVPGHLSDRLQEALWREVLHIVDEGVATTQELDDAVAYGPGLRWAIWGTCLQFHLAGGLGGMRHMLEQFGPALKLPWTKLEAPELTRELIDRMVEGTEAQAAGRSVRELERIRDDCLIAIMQALRPSGEGAGRIVERDEVRRLGAAGHPRWTPGCEVPKPLDHYRGTVLPEWVDYNGHMSEWAYLAAFGWASDVLFRYIGDDEAYRAAGHSFYTVETHINYLRECSVGDPLRVTTQLLGLDDKRLHFFHSMYHGASGEPLATTEQMLVHVDMTAGRAAPIQPEVYEALAAILAAHGDLAVPPQVGSRMSVKPKATAG